MEASGNRDSASWWERAKQTKSYSHSPLVESVLQSFMYVEHLWFMSAFVQLSQ